MPTMRWISWCRIDPMSAETWPGSISVLIKDEVVIRVNTLLAKRAEAMFQYEPQDGPQVSFPNSQDRAAKQPQKKPRRGPR